MVEPKYRNSAGRLLAILVSIPENSAYWDTLPGAFGLQGHNKGPEKQQVCVQCFTELADLYQQFLEDMRKAATNEQQTKVILDGLRGLTAFVYPHRMDAPWPALSEAQKSLLEVAATMIPQEAELPGEDLEAIRASIATLRQLVEKADISPTLRRALLELIRLSEDAIARYKIRGAKSLRSSFKLMLGELAEAYPDSESGPKSASDKSAWQAVKKHLALFDCIVVKVSTYGPLLAGAARFLLGNDVGDDSQ